MNFWNYIQGARKGKEAHRIEKEAMQDPFLADALEGYEAVSGNHQKEVARLQREVNRRQKQMGSKSSSAGKSFPVKAWAIAASILLVVGAGAWLVINELEPPGKDTLSIVMEDKQAKEIQPEAQIEEESEEVSVSTPQAAPVKAVPENPVSVAPEVPSGVSEEVSADASEEVSAMSGSADIASVAVTEDRAIKRERSQEATRTAPALDAVIAESEERVVEEEAAPMESKKVAIEADKPQPVAGLEAYYDYIKRNLKHPTDEECRNMKGEVLVVFKVGESGRPYNIRVPQGLCSSINQEAIRLIIHGPDWKKGRTSDEASIKITF